MTNKICIADEGCEKTKIVARGLCDCHYRMWRLYNRTTRVIGKHGEGCISSDGYKLITINGEQRREHIVLAEKALGRPLPNNAVVHHMNGEKLDNTTIGNLVICPNQSYHMLLHERAKSLGYFPKTWLLGRNAKKKREEFKRDE